MFYITGRFTIVMHSCCWVGSVFGIERYHNANVDGISPLAVVVRLYKGHEIKGMVDIAGIEWDDHF